MQTRSRRTRTELKTLEANPQPAAKKVETNSQPAAQKVEANPQPTAKKVETNPQPAAKKAGANPQPAAKKVEANPQPAAKKVETNPQPAAKKAGANHQPAAKKLETDPQPANETTQIDDNSIDFSEFKAEKVIDESGDAKTITFLGKYRGEPAVCRLEKMPFEGAATKKALNDNEATAELDFVNDKYHSLMLQLSGSLNDLRTTFVWPITPAILSKYSRSETAFVSETPEVYNRIVEPYINKVIKSKDDPNRWVFNILDGKSETENIVLNDPDPDSGFILTRSIKSTGKDEDLHLLAICHRRDIRSLRDLNESHLVLLKNILTKGTKAVKEKYKKLKGSLRLFVHYHPTFYHFHVHFLAVDPSNYQATDRDHLLNTIISNLTLNGDYYKKATMTHPLSLESDLFQELKKAKKI